MQIFKTIEDAAIDALTFLKTQGHVRLLERYYGQMEAADMEGISYQFPCVYVVAGGMRVINDRNLFQGTEIPLEIVVGARMLRGSDPAARGYAASGNIYDIMELINSALNGLNFDEAYMELRLDSVKFRDFDPERAIWIFQMSYKASGNL